MLVVQVDFFWVVMNFEGMVDLFGNDFDSNDFDVVDFWGVDGVEGWIVDLIIGVGLVVILDIGFDLDNVYGQVEMDIE